MMVRYIKEDYLKQLLNKKSKLDILVSRYKFILLKVVFVVEVYIYKYLQVYYFFSHSFFAGSAGAFQLTKRRI